MVTLVATVAHKVKLGLGGFRSRYQRRLDLTVVDLVQRPNLGALHLVSDQLSRSQLVRALPALLGVSCWRLGKYHCGSTCCFSSSPFHPLTTSNVSLMTSYELHEASESTAVEENVCRKAQRRIP